MRRGRRLGIDWGDARIGVAVSDPDGLLASPLDFVPAGDGELDRILELVGEYEPLELVVGLPRSLNGTEGPAAVKVRGKAADLAAALHRSADSDTAGRDTPGIRLVDERLSTVTASRRLRAGGKSAKAQRRLIDSEAAREILDRALDAERASGTPPGQLLSGSEPASESDVDS
ncbi:Holliday junction resolvase RuvX [Microlunatus soli]|uniref:Putative pre-16S rRNA nuclease n=1 Tax=Microlunatus soli TaxID=630515 RepID=A0A1H2AKH3_9ACTN|nr:Holliday junction resolvase RuvX [Microlunatus soli]SDT46453.1 putative holliday junction resolvase [Microlunatus soli]